MPTAAAVGRARARAKGARARVDAREDDKNKRPGSDRGKSVLAPLRRRPRSMGPLYTIDLESKHDGTERPGFTRPFLSGLYDGKTTRQYRNTKSAQALRWDRRHGARGGCVDRLMRAILHPKRSGGMFYAHNGGAFDFLFLVAWLGARRKYKWTLTAQGPNILAIKIELARPKGKRQSEYAWTLVDSLRLLPMSLKQAAKAFGCDTQKQDLDYRTPSRSRAWEPYHAADLVSLHECLTRVSGMLRELGGEMTLTAPSAALKLFLRKFLKEPVTRNLHTPDCDKEACGSHAATGCAHEFVRTSYKGGRVEVFRTSGKRLRYYDINSSYPASMLEPMPVGPLAVFHQLRQPWSHYEDAVLSGEWVGYVRATVYIPPTCNLPPLPVHHPRTGKLVFPVGTFAGTFDVHEVALLREIPGAHIVKIDCLFMYAAAPVFRDMVAALYPLRDSRREDYDEGLAKLVKLLLNALYGKFGQRPDRVEVLYLPRGGAPEGGVPAGGDVDGATVWYVPSAKDALHILPQIASHVTALSRIRLWRALRAVEAAGGHVYYTDTDSIVCDVELPSNKSRLGALKREYECPHLAGTFVRPKVYRLECKCPPRAQRTCKWHQECKKAKKRAVKLVAKGVPSKDVDGAVLTEASFTLFIRGGKVRFSRLAKLRTMAREEMRSPWMVPTHKRLASGYDKRVILPDGSTRPVELSEEVIAA